ncbi:MAG: hypothetical protein AMJ65_11425 [Phycisphaerae bacterium SG8_4]|nr:MAG: hypothetical protein AMJ65_11425 [Phycisphaerae bacterium SG8_4]
MELSWLMKLRIAAAAAVGVALIYGAGWHLAGSPDRIGDMAYGRAVPLVVLGFLAGLIGYFVSWPYGREIGILAAPSGLAVWAFRSGNMADLIQQNPTATQRQELVASLRFEPVFWLIVVAAGFAGVLLAQRIRPSLKLKEPKEEKQGSSAAAHLHAIVALAGSAVVAQFCIKICAQDIRMSDNGLGSVTAQPAAAQIAFAVLVSFGVAAFVFKRFLDVSYVWTALATALVTAFGMHTYAKNVQYLAQAWPATFFSDAVASVLPVQMVAFGALGSVAGYWMAIRYVYWRKHEMN